MSVENLDLNLEGGEVADLEVEGIIGFDGCTIRGFQVHPDRIHVVYALGNKVTIQNWTTKQQVFLTGHTNIISAIDVSASGRFIASGQINHLGFKTRVIIWDFNTHEILCQHELHKVRVEAVAFSKDDRFLLSVGGRDCASVVVWNVQKGQMVCGGAASRGIQGEATAILAMNRRGGCFMTAGDNHLTVWEVDENARKANCIDIKTGKLKRNIICLDVDERDELCFCGTTTGDILKVRLNYHHDPEVLKPIKTPMVMGCITKISSKKHLTMGGVDLYCGGIAALRRMFKGWIVVGAGDGTIDLLEEVQINFNHNTGKVKSPSTPALKVLRSTSVHAKVTSLQFMHDNTVILAGTIRSEIFAIDLDTFDTRLLVTCHTSAIYDVAFPRNFSDVFATCGKNDVRLWSVRSKQELLRINVPNFSCSSVLFSHDGKSILTAWNDGIIRSFTPLTGRLIYAILNAHNKGVAALDTNREGNLLVSGGCEGQVRLWDVSPQRQVLVCTMKEHRAPITSVHVNEACDEAVSASTDGSCITWDLRTHSRKQIFFSFTLFMCARYYPTDVQILTAGSDRKIAYWEVADGGLVREVEGSRSGTINTLDISLDGKLFVTGGNDQIVKLWRYQEGIVTHIGMGHSAVVTATKLSPDGKHIVSASGSGSIFIWKCPELEDLAEDAEKPEEGGDGDKIKGGSVHDDGRESVRELLETPGNGRTASRQNRQAKCRCCQCPKIAVGKKIK